MKAKAAASIAAGLTDVAVLFFGRAGGRTGPSGTATPKARAPRTHDWSFDTAGGYMTSWYAMWAQRYMHEFNVTHADLAEVAVFIRYHATLNPDSVMGGKGEITGEDVLASRYVCEPLHLLDAPSTTTAATPS